MTDFLVLLTLFCFTVFSVNRPHIAMLLVVWVNSYKPQESSYGIANSMPISMMTFVLFIFVMIINIRKISVPKSFFYHFIFISIMVSLAISNYYALFPFTASFKFDNVIRTLLPIYFIPFVITDREKLEEFLWVAIISLGTYAIFGGVKSLLGGGGYGVALVDSIFWREGSIFSNQMIATIPISLWLAKHSYIAKKNKYASWLAYSYCFFSLATLIGTQARSGMICVAILFIFAFLASKQKIKLSFFTILIAVVLIPQIPDSFFERMSTITNSQNIQNERSAMGRVAVWRWGVGRIAERPLIGWGFTSYIANAGELNRFVKDGETDVASGATAYHNMLFEVAASNGLIGLGLFLLMLSFIFFKSRILGHAESTPDDLKALCKSIYVSMLVYSAGGMFVAYAYYPWLYYLFCAAVVLQLQLTKPKLKN
jgi:probable O-glycosylation ligase (exosortase A-associated)